MKSNILLSSVIFPSNVPYFNDYLKGLSSQSDKNFDLLLINEGVDLSKYDFSGINVTIIESNLSPAENRVLSIKYAIQNNYSYILWQDTDDIMLENRISFLRKHSKDADVLVHDSIIFTDEGDVLGNIIGNFIEDMNYIFYEDIATFNFIGFVNMMVNVKCFERLSSVNTMNNVVAVDWCLISQLLLNGCSVKYFSETLGMYRQHANNIASVGGLSYGAFLSQLDIISKHYNYLQQYFGLKLNAYPRVIDYIQKLESINKDNIDEIDYVNLSSGVTVSNIWWKTIYNIIMKYFETEEKCQT